MKINKPESQEALCRRIELYAGKDRLKLVQFVAFGFDKIGKAEHVDKKDISGLKWFCHNSMGGSLWCFHSIMRKLESLQQW